MVALLQDVDDVELVLGEYLGKAVGSLDRSSSWPLRVSISPRLSASSMLVPSPAVRRFPWRWQVVACHHLHFTPICRAVAMVDLESSRGGSKSGKTPRNRHVPSSSVRATPRERKPRAANALTALSTAALTSPALAANARITCGAPFVTLNVFRPRLDCGFGAFVDRIKRLKVSDMIGL